MSLHVAQTGALMTLLCYADKGAVFTAISRNKVNKKLFFCDDVVLKRPLVKVRGAKMHWFCNDSQGVWKIIPQPDRSLVVHSHKVTWVQVVEIICRKFHPTGKKLECFTSERHNVSIWQINDRNISLL